jgi:hypothetical protein
MANLSSSTYLESGMHQYGIFQFMDGISGGGNYIHMETNITQPSSNIMCMIEAVGYCYGRALPIRCAWNFYSYQYIISNTNNSSYTGMNADGVYYASSGYVAIRAYASDLYYCGFTLNSYMVAGNGYQYPVSIRRVSQNSTSGAYY